MIFNVTDIWCRRIMNYFKKLKCGNQSLRVGLHFFFLRKEEHRTVVVRQMITSARKVNYKFRLAGPDGNEVSQYVGHWVSREATRSLLTLPCTRQLSTRSKPLALGQHWLTIIEWYLHKCSGTGNNGGDCRHFRL